MSMASRGHNVQVFANIYHGVTIDHDGINPVCAACFHSYGPVNIHNAAAACGYAVRHKAVVLASACGCRHVAAHIYLAAPVDP
ncbi:hypothetical protein SDC9_163043 [bioreactor metagenome]|uniref:Uncharacterized protein n=1 Tax=bioreactor metagenome TaxID=1076179 RepID=A0A645FQP5_9ZZZZ